MQLTNQTFNPLEQVFVIKAADGTPVNVTVASIRTIQLTTVYTAIGMGTQIGAAAVLLIALFLMTKTDKRRSYVFLLNCLALVLVVARGIVECVSLTGPFSDWYRWMTYYYTGTGSAKAVSVSSEVLTFLLTAVIALSLVLQVRVVCCALEPWKRHPINVSNIVLTCAAVAVRFILMVMDCHWNIVNVETESRFHYELLSRFAEAANILLVISIGYSAIIFCGKLACAIDSRRSMGMKQFGPIQIIFIMGCQTMCTPLIFTIITYFGIENGQMQSFVPTIVALSLPLSAMWAAVNTTKIHIADADVRFDRSIPVGVDSLASATAYGTNKKSFNTLDGATDTLVDNESTRHLTSPQRRMEPATSRFDLEMQKLEDGVRVGRSYSVRSD